MICWDIFLDHLWKQQITILMCSGLVMGVGPIAIVFCTKLAIVVVFGDFYFLLSEFNELRFI